MCELQKTQCRFLEEIALYLRPNTVKDSRSAINLFIGYLKSAHPGLSSFAELKRSHYVGWLRYLARRPLKQNSRRNRIIKVRCFLQAIQEWGWREAPRLSLFRRGDLPPEDRCLPRPLSEETDRALEDELRKRDGFIHKALLLLRATGLRSQELLDLRIDSLRKFPAGEWAVHVPLGKLHNERVIPVDAETARIFEEIRQLRGSPQPATDPETGKPAHFLLMRPSGQRFSRDAFRYHLGKIERDVQLREHPSPHRLRHTFATEMLRAGMSLPVLMKILGHRTIGMVLRYTLVTAADVQRAYTEASAALEGRYKIPTYPALHRQSTRKSTRQAIVYRLEAFAAQVEAFRCDFAKESEKKKIQRFVERLRRLAADFKDLTS
jgi:integrase/recombinase XerC